MYTIEKITETETDIIDVEEVKACRTLQEAMDEAKELAKYEKGLYKNGWVRFAIMFDGEEQYSAYSLSAWLRAQGATDDAIDSLVYGVQHEMDLRGCSKKPKREDFDTEEDYETWLEDYNSNLEEIYSELAECDMLQYLDEDGWCKLPEVVVEVM